MDFYIFLFMYILSLDEEDMNGLESYLKELIVEEELVKAMPINTSLAFIRAGGSS